MMRCIRNGTTLIELLIVIAILSTLAAVASLAMPRKVIPPDDTPHRIANARTESIRTGQRVRTTIRLRSGFAAVTTLPDGTVLADTGAHIERLTGRTIRVADTTRTVAP